MILNRLQISGFLSYQEKVEIDFSSINLACISGENGAGKSSLLEAITWALFGEARRKDDAVINTSSRAADVTLDFEYESVQYQVQRSKTKDKSATLEFRVRNPQGTWLPLTEATMRATDDLISQTLHLDYETFINASFFLQGKADQFTQQRPADRKRILSGILGLDVWERYREETQRRRKLHETELLLINNSLEEIEKELQLEAERKDRLSRLEKEVESKKALFEARKTLLDQHRVIADRVQNDRHQVEKQRTEVQRLRAENERKAEELSLRLQDRAQYQDLLKNEKQILRAVEDWESARAALEGWEQIAANFRQYDSQRNEPQRVIDIERTRLQSEQGVLQQKQHEISIIEQDLPELESIVAQSANAVAELTAKLAVRADVEKEMRTQQDEKSRVRAENIQLRAEMDEIRVHRDHLQQISGATCPTCEKPLSQEEGLRLVEEVNNRGKEKGDLYRTNVKISDQCDLRLRELENALIDLESVDASLKLQQRIYDAKSDELLKQQQAVAAWQGKEAARLIELDSILSTDTYALEARQQLTLLDARLKELGYDAAAHEKTRRLEIEGRASLEKKTQLENAKAALVPLEREITSSQKTIENEEKHYSALLVELKQNEEKLATESANLPDTTRLEAEYYDAQEQMNRANNDLGYARNAVDILDKQREQKIVKLEEKDQLNTKITDLKSLERAFGKDGIPALLIEQALPAIENHANEILDRLSSGSMSIHFETQREYKDKKREDRRETLDIFIRDSAGERVYELFSGGEAFRINFAIRLALSRVLAHRAGARMQTLVIDEGFGSQDSSGRQRLVEAINLVSSEFAKILVITHLEELKDVFPARIEVSKSATGSKVQVLL